MGSQGNLQRSVLIVGAGGLGCPAALALVAGGARRITIADADTVEVSNLHRQILHTPADIERNKARVVGERLRAVVSDVEVEVVPLRVSPENAGALVSRHDFVIDATDSPGAKFLLNDACVLRNRPLAHAGVVGFEGQLLTVLPTLSACLRCLFPEPPTAEEVPSCHEAGILGPIAGVVGALQAEEALRWLRGEPCAFADRLLTLDARTFATRIVPLRRSSECPLCGPRATIHEIAPNQALCEENP